MAECHKSISILIVDDEAPLRRALERYLRGLGVQVQCAGSVTDGKAALDAARYDMALVDFRLPDGTGDEVIRYAVDGKRVGVVYCMTGFASCRTAVDVMQAGCRDILEKPFDVEHIQELIRALRTARGDADELDRWRADNASDVLGDDPQLVDALETIRNVADTDCTVLVTGESGTGKELAARALHSASRRAKGPFVALNCAAIPESMIEAELFGHAKGAFTGAMANRGGRIAAADGGTLFLDEIGDMPLAAQAKLLRVLQDRTIMPVGADDPVQIDVRVVAATNRDLEQMVADGTFRADLYFRLSVIPVHLPALRERGQDVVMLARAFLAAANARNGRSVAGFSAAAEKQLLSHAWPGNVRELGHVVERAVLLKGSGVIGDTDLRLGGRRKTGPAPAQTAPATVAATSVSAPASEVGLDLKRAIEQVERQLIDEALQRTGGNRTEAAALLGLNRTTLVEKLRKHGA